MTGLAHISLRLPARLAVLLSLCVPVLVSTARAQVPPGEVMDVRVAAVDALSGAMDITFQPACSAAIFQPPPSQTISSVLRTLSA